MRIYAWTFLVVVFFLVYGCAEQKSSISVYCEKNTKGKYVLKWEVYPDVDNAPLEIFASGNDSLFPSVPTIVTKTSEYISVVDTKDTLGREYFILKSGNSLSGIVSNRFFNTDSIQNLRDIGGYYTSDERQVRWGMIYRSGTFNQMTSKDSIELAKLKLKTVIDLRVKNAPKPKRLHVDNYIKLPMDVGSYDHVKEKIVEDRFFRGDAVIYTQDIYKTLIENYSEQYAQFFDYLCDKDNYPLAYNCFLGKDQAALATYFLLRALDIPEPTIEDDYMFSNIGIKKSKLVGKNVNIDELSESAQEALTMLGNADLSFLRFAISLMRKKSGSVDNYMLKELKITQEKRKKLREILLY